ncbi:hypothetical protein [Kutzneria kofuensis]|uniref:Uncharacterized protein n=1 Tax=Kutzneria kofuensis TaxID=103725 RepID=A0A7W9KL34_9PSEU|nr:hypothetical protein [Kutzneria kofuensis]MBB5893839.1 hypothetical protein [Kutzneria kofuensis]
MRTPLQLALVAAVGYLVAGGLIGVALLASHGTAAVAGIPAAVPAPSSTAPTGPPKGFQQVSGPSGLVTVIPDGWKISSIRNGFQADDPRNGGASGRFVRYQGVAGEADLYTWLTAYEKQSWSTQPGYQRVQMSQQKYLNNPAVLWEFTYALNGAPRHVKILYWNAGGTQYDVYASAPAADWAQTSPLFDAMVANSAVR